MVQKRALSDGVANSRPFLLVTKRVRDRFLNDLKATLRVNLKVNDSENSEPDRCKCRYERGQMGQTDAGARVSLPAERPAVFRNEIEDSGSDVQIEETGYR